MPTQSNPSIPLIPVRERLIFALDVPGRDEAVKLIDRLGDSVQFYKLGLELCMTPHYFELVELLVGRGKKVFADLKLLDIAETVRRAIGQLKNMGVTFTTIHPNGDDALQAVAAEKGAMRVLVVTVLTSLSATDLRRLGVEGSVMETVLARAKQARDAHIDGVIASGHEAAIVRDALGKDFLIVTPGIRPAGERVADDQKRVVTPADAFRNGSDYIVVGRPIRDAADPRAAAEAIQKEIAAVF